MSEMEKRVAKAAQEQARSMGSFFDDYVAAEVARAAIEAMREPTQQMRLAGIAEWATPDPTPGHESTLVFNAIWRAMIDAALAKTPA